MIPVRSVIYFVLLSLSVVVFSIPMLLLFKFSSFETTSKLANFWGKINIKLLVPICGLRHEIHGWENLPEKNCIVMAKHQSTWETIALRALLPPKQTWVLKKELLSVPFFGWALRACEPIAIDRTSGRKAVKQVIEQGKSALEKGRWVVVFPEGTRVPHGQRGKYGIGGGLLAEHTGAPIVPIAHNAGVFWKRRGVKKFPGTIQVVVGKPIVPNGRKASELTREVEHWIESQMETLPNTPNREF